MDTEREEIYTDRELLVQLKAGNQTAFTAIYKLQMVMRQIARWYNVSVKYEGQSTSKQYGGAIQRNLKLSQVLKILENNHLHFKLEGKEVTVMP